jgi:hypothetical protein
MTAAHMGICRDAGMQTRAWADGRRGQVWCSRRRTRGGVLVEHCAGDEGRVTCGWSTDRNVREPHTYGCERGRWAAPARRRRQRCRGLRAAGPPCAGVGCAGKALQNDGKCDSIQSPIVWWTYVCPQLWTGRHAPSPAKENRARARPPHARQVTCRHVILCSCPSTLLPGGMTLDLCLHRLVYNRCNIRGACSVRPRHATPLA